MREEIWKDVPGWIGFYQASNLGRIRSVTRSFIRKGPLSCKITLKGKIIRPAKHETGYLFLVFHKVGSVKNVSVHRAVASAFIKNPKSRPCVNHKNGKKHDNRVENLEWVNRSENALHAIANRLVSTWGDTHPMAKLESKFIALILSSSLSYAQLGKIFGVSASAIQHVKEGKTWKSVVRK